MKNLDAAVQTLLQFGCVEGLDRRRDSGATHPDPWPPVGNAVLFLVHLCSVHIVVSEEHMQNNDHDLRYKQVASFIEFHYLGPTLMNGLPYLLLMLTHEWIHQTHDVQSRHSKSPVMRCKAETNLPACVEQDKMHMTAYFFKWSEQHDLGVGLIINTTINYLLLCDSATNV